MVFGDCIVFLYIFDNFLMVNAECVLELPQLTQKMSFICFKVYRIQKSTWNLSTLHIRANARKVAPLSLVHDQ